jgi:RNA 2',3'-cyclic 3'-phosphodiesterase
VASRRRSEPRPSGHPGSPRARLFVALDLPDGARQRLAEWRDAALAARPDLRPVAPQALHVTLVFIGYRPEKEVDAIARTVAGAAAGLPRTRLTPLRVMPLPPRRPRLFALDLDDDGARAGAVQAALSDALAAARVYEPERRAFWPHVTLARVKRDARAAPLAAEPPGEAFDAGTVTLYRSLLSPRGPRYEPLTRVELG